MNNLDLLEVPKGLSNLEFRHLLPTDVNQFRNLFQESRNSIETFLDFGPVIADSAPIEYLNTYSHMLRNEPDKHYGLFFKRRMLAFGSFVPAFLPSGLQVIGLVRQSEMGRNLGTYMLHEMMSTALVTFDADFIQVTIDKANIGSRSVAKKLGFVPLFAITAVGPGNMASGTQITYVKLNSRLTLMASTHEMRPIDLLGHLCFIPNLEHLVHDPIVNRHFQWKLPIYQEDDLEMFHKYAGK
jgi:hypothetical protein